MLCSLQVVCHLNERSIGDRLLDTIPVLLGEHALYVRPGIGLHSFHGRAQASYCEANKASKLVANDTRLEEDVVLGLGCQPSLRLLMLKTITSRVHNVSFQYKRYEKI
jgi:hypothetical protein